MSNIRYSKDVDILHVELSDKPVHHAQDSGPFIIHFSEEDEPVLLEVQGGKDFLLKSLHALFEEEEAALM